jgi:hypothetical protein
MAVSLLHEPGPRVAKTLVAGYKRRCQPSKMIAFLFSRRAWSPQVSVWQRRASLPAKRGSYLSIGALMDHKEQHHERHEKEREEHKKKQKQHEQEEAKSGLPFHPAWFVVLGVVMVLVAVLIWTFAF